MISRTLINVIDILPTQYQAICRYIMLQSLLIKQSIKCRRYTPNVEVLSAQQKPVNTKMSRHKLIEDF